MNDVDQLLAEVSAEDIRLLYLVFGRRQGDGAPLGRNAHNAAGTLTKFFAPGIVERRPVFGALGDEHVRLTDLGCELLRAWAELEEAKEAYEGASSYYGDYDREFRVGTRGVAAGQHVSVDADGMVVPANGSSPVVGVVVRVLSGGSSCRVMLNR